MRAEDTAKNWILGDYFVRMVLFTFINAEFICGNLAKFVLFLDSSLN